MLFLICADDTRLVIKPIVSDYPTGFQLWQVIPTTDSTGKIVNVNIVENQRFVEPNQQHQDKCFVVGRVVQLSERSGSVQFKVKRPGEKTLKLTLLSPDPHMKVGQLWSCTAVRVGCTLEILQATPLESGGSSSTEEPCVQTLALLDEGATQISQNQQTNQQLALTQLLLSLSAPLPPTDMASEALLLETGIGGWELSRPQKRSFGWEWEALHRKLVKRARVQVYRHGEHKVYQFMLPPPQQRKHIRVNYRCLIQIQKLMIILSHKHNLV